MSRDIIKRRMKLWKEHKGICNWCGIKTVLPNGNGKQKLSDDTATLDHLINKLDPKREIPNLTNEVRTTLSCKRCNEIRGLLGQKALSKNSCITIKKELKYR